MDSSSLTPARLRGDRDAVRDYVRDQLDQTNPRIDTVVVTHPDADHYNYLPDVLTDDIEVGQVLLVEGNDDYEVPGGDFDAVERLRVRVRRAVYGAECYAYGLLASGHVDLVAEATMQPYDFLALAPIVAGAGGVITDWRGEPLTLGSGGRVLAAGDARIHGAALEVLAG